MNNLCIHHTKKKPCLLHMLPCLCLVGWEWFYLYERAVGSDALHGPEPYRGRGREAKRSELGIYKQRKTLGLKTCFVDGGVVSAIDIGFFKNLFLFYWSIAYFLTFKSVYSQKKGVCNYLLSSRYLYFSQAHHPII